MLINSPVEEPRWVDDWDINFINGSAISITVDPTTGDSCDYTPGSTVACFRVGSKPSPVDPEGIIQPEDAFIPIVNVLCIRRRSRLVEPASPEEKEEWQRVIQELTASDVKH